ncbi:MAG: hypothetical protein EPN22_12865 [Nitrospirae bacterium]|nr:MAG: hypothetical protein EPN22_12865 [Nitrospirota bacterium]
MMIPDLKFRISNLKSQISNLIAAALTVLAVIYSVPASAQLSITANHDNITIDFFYHGSTVSVKGVSEPNTDLIIKISSPEGIETLKQKGKVAGFLWMNTGTLHLKNTPNLYSVHSTKKIEELLSREEADKYLLGYEALEKHADLSPVSGEAEKTKWFEEFIRLKESLSLYKTSSGTISLTPDAGRQKYYIKTDWPYQAPPGDYLVTVYAVKDGNVIEQAGAHVNVEQVGVVRYLSDMAKNSGAVYGIISIVAALGAGFGVGMIFKKGGGAH